MAMSMERFGLQHALRINGRTAAPSKRSFSSSVNHNDAYETTKWEKITYLGIASCTILAFYNLSKGHPHFEELRHTLLICTSGTRSSPGGGVHTQAHGGIHTQTQDGFQTQNQMGNSAMNTAVRNTLVVNQEPVANQHTGPYTHTGNMSIADRVMEFLNDPKNKVFMATWNVGGKPPHSGLNLNDFLKVEDQSDIYVLGGSFVNFQDSLSSLIQDYLRRGLHG